MKSLYIPFAFIFFSVVTMIEVEGYEYDPPKIVYGEPIVKDCRASAVNEVAYSMMDENGHAGCEKHQWVEDKTRLAELKRAMPRRVQ
jgi:hypothetical protein